MVLGLEDGLISWQRERVEAMGPASRAMGLASSGDGSGEQ